MEGLKPQDLISLRLKLAGGSWRLSSRNDGGGTCGMARILECSDSFFSNQVDQPKDTLYRQPLMIDPFEIYLHPISATETLFDTRQLS